MSIMTKRKICDSCGKIDPPVTANGNQRITLCCITKGGFYHTSEMKKGYGSNGKTTTMTVKLQFPIKIVWAGWFKSARL